MANDSQKLQGVGLGYRLPLAQQLLDQLPPLDFLEIAPENWINVGGKRQKQLQKLHQHYPLVGHGLSLSLGSQDPLDRKFLKQLGKFLQDQEIIFYSEHLSYSSHQGQLYELLPIPFLEQAVSHVVARIQQVQDYLQRPLIIENISYYCAQPAELSELEFIQQILQQSDCQLLLDINNVYVNSINHDYVAADFIKKLQGYPVTYLHIAGHQQLNNHLLIDTHGSPVSEPVWELLQLAYQTFGPLPTLLERDFSIPPLEELLAEIAIIKNLQSNYQGQR